jgi:hypothetical protein
MKNYMISGIDGDGKEIVAEYDFPTIRDAVTKARGIAKTPEYLDKGLCAVQIFEEVIEKNYIMEIMVKRGI